MERRAASRREVWFPMRIETSAVGERLAVSRNMSRTGLLMATATVLEVGAPVKIAYRETAEGKEERAIEGRIVRFEPNRDDPDGLWPYMVAVEFSDPLPPEP